MPLTQKLVALATTVAQAAQQANITVKTSDDSGGEWYTRPVWIAIAIIVLVLILVLIAQADRRNRTTILK